jgi:hypothetical protein
MLFASSPTSLCLKRERERERFLEP